MINGPTRILGSVNVAIGRIQFSFQEGPGDDQTRLLLISFNRNRGRQMIVFDPYISRIPDEERDDTTQGKIAMTVVWGNETVSLVQ